MATTALSIVLSRILHIENVIANFTNLKFKDDTTNTNGRNNGKKGSGILYDDVANDGKLLKKLNNGDFIELNDTCQIISTVVENDFHFCSFSTMLVNMDSVCSASLRTFQSVLPDVQSHTHVNRKRILLGILHRYSEWMIMEEPKEHSSKPVKEDSSRTDNEINGIAIMNKSGVKDTNKKHENHGILVEEGPSSLSNYWEIYNIWYSERMKAMMQIEKEFNNLIEDERENGGRLLRKWYALSKPPLVSLNQSEKKNHETEGEGRENYNDSSKNYEFEKEKEKEKGKEQEKEEDRIAICKDKNRNKDDRHKKVGGLSKNEIYNNNDIDINIENNCNNDNNNNDNNNYINNSNNNSTNYDRKKNKIIDNNCEENYPTTSSFDSAQYEYEKIQIKSFNKNEKVVQNHGNNSSEISGNIPQNISENVPLQNSYHSPRCISAFIKYFVSYYIIQPYELKDEKLQNATYALLETLVFRRLNSRIFRYSSKSLKVGLMYLSMLIFFLYVFSYSIRFYLFCSFVFL